MSGSSFDDSFLLIQSGLALGGIYALQALGFHMVFATSNILNFAVGPVTLLGGLIFLSLVQSFGINFLLGLFIVLIAGGAIGYYIFNGLVLAPARAKGPWTQILCVMAAGMVVEYSFLLIWGKNPLPVPNFTGTRPLHLFGLSFFPQYLWVIGLSFVGVVTLKLFMDRSLRGQAMRATANNPVLVRLVGISTASATGTAFAASCALMSLAGAIISPITFAGGYQATSLSIKAFTGAVIGGLNSSVGAMAGGVILGLAEAFVSRYVTTEYNDAVIMGILLVMLLARPEGLFGSKAAR